MRHGQLPFGIVLLQGLVKLKTYPEAQESWPIGSGVSHGPTMPLLNFPPLEPRALYVGSKTQPPSPFIGRGWHRRDPQLVLVQDFDFQMEPK